MGKLEGVTDILYKPKSNQIYKMWMLQIVNIVVYYTAIFFQKLNSSGPRFDTRG